MLSGPASVATTPKMSRCLSAIAIAPKPPAETPSKACPSTLRADRVGLHQERHNFGNEVILEATAQAVDPERMGGSHPVRSFVRSIRGRDQGRRYLAPAHHAVKHLQIAGVEKVVLVDVGTVEEQDGSIQKKSVELRRLGFDTANAILDNCYLLEST